jgi:Mrp family chromosome partitioning ATPase
MGLFSRGIRSEDDQRPSRDGSPANGTDPASQRVVEPDPPATAEKAAPEQQPPVTEPVAAEQSSEPEPSAPEPVASEPEPSEPEPPPQPAASAEPAGARPFAPSVAESVPEPSDEELRITASEAIAPRRPPAAAEPGDGAPTRRAKVISFANQKGGVAKTTTTLNLAVAFAESGHDVLCIDLDPQGNLTMSQGIDPDKV